MKTEIVKNHFNKYHGIEHRLGKILIENILSNLFNQHIIYAMIDESDDVLDDNVIYKSPCVRFASEDETKRIRIYNWGYYEDIMENNTIQKSTRWRYTIS